MARARVLDELDALEGLIEGRFRGLGREQIADQHGVGVATACDRLPMLRPEFERDAAAALLAELDGVAVLAQLDDSDTGDGAAGPRLRAALAELEDLDASLGVARTGAALSVVELIGVAELCRASARLAAIVREAEIRDLDELHARGLRACIDRLRSARRGTANEDLSRPCIDELPSLLAELDRSIDRRGDEPCIAADASPELAEARRSVRAARQSLLAKADRLLRNPAIAASLRDSYWTQRDGRVVLPVRSDSLGAVRERGAIIHGSSGTGQTFYVEPATIVEDNNALREAELRAAEEERKVLRALSAKVAGVADTLAGMQRACVAFDLMRARWSFGASLDAVIPELVEAPSAERPGIELRAARHPLMLIDGVDVVPNDIVLARGHALVISGPNAGGKTVALKTLGLFALMAAAGLALPCQGRAAIPVFRQIITDVGDDQSIAANLSTFSAHIGHVRTALEAAEADGAGTLVLLDEVAVGTDPEQGAALAEAILVGLVEAGATVVVTTHYDRLKLLATQPDAHNGAGARFHNAAVGFDIQRMRPTFRLSLGVPGSSSAIAVARRLGLPEAVLVEAERLLGDEGVKIDELLRDIESERQSLARTRERLERDQQRLAHRDHEVRTRERRVLEGVRSRKAKAYAAAADQLRALERELKDKRKLVREAAPERVDQLPTRAELAGAARVMLASHRAADEAELEAERADQRLEPRKLEVGAKVRVLSMNQEGEVVALQGSPPKRAVVQLPNLRTTVKVSDLGLPPPEKPSLKIKPGKAAPILDFKSAVREQAAAHFGDSPVPVKQGVDNTCDVRGQRFEDAQEKVADFVADALSRDQDVILVVHGHGGGALKKAVRELLTRLGSVKRHRPGLAQEGGDAVTIAWLE